MKFSVSMCVYGGDNPNNFEEALLSVINQTVQPNEIVLVVDGKIPVETKTIINKAKNIFENLNTIFLEKNVGHGDARRIGLENCKYDLVALMDADDISVETRFENQIAIFKNNPNLSIVGGYIDEFIDSVNNVVSTRKVPLEDRKIKEYIKKRCPFNQVTVMFKKKDIESVGGYIDWFCNEDYYLWIRMFEAKYLFENINKVLVKVRVGQDMYKRRGGYKYFKSESKLQKYMYSKKIIGKKDIVVNISIRFVVQVLIPNKIREILFKYVIRRV